MILELDIKGYLFRLVIGVIVFAVCLFNLLWQTSPQNKPKKTGHQNNPCLAFTAENGSNAFAHVEGLVKDCTPRDAMTPGAERAALWIQARLAAHGINASLDRFTAKTHDGERAFVNVMAPLPGPTNQTIVLLSHFDTKSGIAENFQGANDSGSSTGLLIEIARIIAQNKNYPFKVVIAFLDGEECCVRYGPHDGLHGSRHLAAKLRRAKENVKAVILADMIGDRDLNIMLPRNGTPKLRALALKAADATGDRAHITLYDGDILDDHQPFLDAGFPAVDLIDFKYGSVPGANDYWHTPEDTLDKISPESLTITGRIVTEMLNMLGQE
jgi:Zn-dependent M28 family amino/carboxypeptidase